MTATQRVEGFFGKLKKTLGRPVSLVRLADELQRIVVRGIDHSKDAARDTRTRDQLPARLENATQFKAMLTEVRQKGTQYRRRYVENEVHQSLFYDCTVYDPGMPLPVNSDSEGSDGEADHADDSSGAGPLGGAGAAAAGGVAGGTGGINPDARAGLEGEMDAAGEAEEEEQTDDEQEAQERLRFAQAAFPDGPCDSSGVSLEAMRTAFDNFGKAFVVASRDGGASGRRHRRHIVCIDRAGAHVCTCTLTFRVGMPCRHFFACRFQHAAHVPLQILDVIHPRWLRGRVSPAAARSGVSDSPGQLARPMPGSAAASVGKAYQNYFHSLTLNLVGGAWLPTS